MQSQVQLNYTLWCNFTCIFLCIFMEIAKCIFRSTIKCTLRCTPWLHYQVDYQLQRKMHLFHHILCIFKCSLKWNFRCALKCNIEWHLNFTFLLNRFVHSWTITSAPPCAFKCNSIVLSSAPLTLTSNAPSGAALYRSQSIPLGVSSDELSVASPIPLTNPTSSAPSSAMSNVFFLSPSYASSMAP